MKFIEEVLDNEYGVFGALLVAMLMIVAVFIMLPVMVIELVHDIPEFYYLIVHVWSHLFFVISKIGG